MAERDLPPVPYQTPMLDPGGTANRIWAEWFKGLATPWSSLRAATGYQKLIGGLIVQWGVTGSVSSGATSSIVFPAEFPTACLIAFVGVKDNSAIATTATGQPGVGNYSATGVDLYNRTSVSQVLNWIAIGH